MRLSTVKFKISLRHLFMNDWERYRHFFIDEFQDTSEMQWQNLIPLIDNALAGQDDYGERNFDDCGRS
jgi:superfamily I DNA/RNA helicase